MKSRAAAHRALDRTDLKILGALQRDGRLSNLKLADAVHLSPTAVMGRVRRLVREGYILGYEARLGPSGGGLVVLIEVTLDRTAAEFVEAFKAAVHARPEIVECCMVAGAFDYLLKVWLPSAEGFSDSIAAVVWSLPGVRETRSYMVASEIKSDERQAG
jgi:Lrp/AsnC family leucine-responsive transcriptional regulator